MTALGLISEYDGFLAKERAEVERLILRCATLVTRAINFLSLSCFIFSLILHRKLTKTHNSGFLVLYTLCLLWKTKENKISSCCVLVYQSICVNKKAITWFSFQTGGKCVGICIGVGIQSNQLQINHNILRGQVQSDFQVWTQISDWFWRLSKIHDCLELIYTRTNR